ncbi:MAG: hypothetical protein M0Z28_29200 [Rhodospirillales bacterium]|nr:hypothetical protein [Rhodospirillales bacterium]
MIATVGIVVIVRNPAGAPVFARYGAAHAAQPFYFNTSNAPEASTELTEAMRRVVTNMIDDPAFRQGVRGAQ